MNIEIVVHRGEVTNVTDYGILLHKLDEFVEKENKPDKDSEYRKFRESLRDFIASTSIIIGPESEGPFTLIIKVEGHKKYVPPGTAKLY